MGVFMQGEEEELSMLLLIDSLGNFTLGQYLMRCVFYIGATTRCVFGLIICF